MAKYNSVETLAHLALAEGGKLRITFNEFWCVFIEYPKNTLMNTSCPMSEPITWDVLATKEPPKKTLAVFGGRGEPLSKVANRANGILGSKIKEMNDATT